MRPETRTAMVMRVTSMRPLKEKSGMRSATSYFLSPGVLAGGSDFQFFTAIIYLVFFSLFSRLFSLSNLPVFLLDYSFLCPSFNSGHYSSLTPGYVSLVSYSFPTLYNSQLCSNLFLAKEMKVGLFKSPTL